MTASKTTAPPSRFLALLPQTDRKKIYDFFGTPERVTAHLADDGWRAFIRTLMRPYELPVIELDEP